MYSQFWKTVQLVTFGSIGLNLFEVVLLVSELDIGIFRSLSLTTNASFTLSMGLICISDGTWV